MGRNTLSDWQQCERCQRHHHRLGVVRCIWPKEVRVVVLTAVANAASQVVSSAPPRAMVLARRLQDWTGVECVADVLVACGVGETATPDEAAACSRRFLDQCVAPDLIVFATMEDLRLAQAAGLVTEEEDAMWQQAGYADPVRAVVADDDVERKMARHLGLDVPRRRRPGRSRLPTRAAELRKLLGGHRGRATLSLTGRDWKYSSGGRLTVRQIQRHLRGEHWVAPSQTVGPWPYVVLDLNRNDAIQDKYFDRTLASILDDFPESFPVRSAESGGAHTYVKLPPDTYYGTAARWLRAYVTLQEWRWASEKAADGRVAQSELVKVPDHPPRLPFGRGSSMVGSNEPLTAQLDQFLEFLRDAPPTDYEEACEVVHRRVRPGVHYQTQKRALERFLVAEELALPKLRPSPLRGPWKKVERCLTPAARQVAAMGVPAFGTRHRWTMALITELADLVPKDEVIGLMKLWLRDPEVHHSSEAILSDPMGAERHTIEFIEAHYRRIRGVPIRAWKKIAQAVAGTSYWLTGRHPRSRPVRTLGQWHHIRRAGLKNYTHITKDDALRTAFFVARYFFSQRERELEVPASYFDRWCRSNTASAMAEILTLDHLWLERTGRGTLKGKHGAKFQLTSDLWPMIPAEPVYFIPPRLSLPRKPPR